MRILLRAPQPAATLGASVSVANRTYHELNCRNEEHLAQLQRRVEAAVERLCPERFHYWNVPSHSLYDAGRFFDADETEWLRRVKDAYDPSDLFRVRNGIRSSSSGRSCDSAGEEEGGKEAREDGRGGEEASGLSAQGVWRRSRLEVCFFSHSTHFSHMSEPILPISHLEILFFKSRPQWMGMLATVARYFGAMRLGYLLDSAYGHGACRSTLTGSWARWLAGC